MADVTVTCTETDRGWTCEVSVTAERTTQHTVDVPRNDYEELTGTTNPDVEELVEESFQFLLEREPQSAIMSQFNIMTIERYFPEFPDEIPRSS